MPHRPRKGPVDEHQEKAPGDGELQDDPGLAAIRADLELADKLEASKTAEDAAPLLAEAQRREWPDSGTRFLPDGHPAKPHPAPPQPLQIPAGAWKEPVAANDRAAVMLGEWYERLEIYLELVRLHELPTAVARDHLEALRDIGTHVDHALSAAKKALERMGARRFAVAGLITKEDLQAMYTACSELERAAVQAGEVTFNISERAKSALATPAFDQASRLRLRERPISQKQYLACERGMGRILPEGLLVKDVHPQAFANEVFRNYQDPPQDAAAWAYFAIGHYVSDVPVDDEGWDRLRAIWSSTLNCAARQAQRDRVGTRRPRVKG